MIVCPIRTRFIDRRKTALTVSSLTVSRAALIGSAGYLRCRLISRESLARFRGEPAIQAGSSPGSGFDIDSYLAKHGFVVKQCKPWSSHPGGLIYELSQCPF